MAGIELKDVRKVYAGGVEAVKGVSLDVQDGHFVVLVGPSGCGKSTLLRMVAGLESITSGTIAIGGRTVNELEPAERDIAMVFQNYALYPHMTVRRNLEYGLRNRRIPSDEITRRVNEAAAILEIAPLLDRKPGQLSGGQRQRVAMGRAIVREPAAFLFDEPLSNLDAKLRVQMRAEIRSLQRRLGTTSLYVTHDQLEAMTLADQLVVLSAGHIEQAGSPMEIYERPATLFVATFIGSPAMNLLPIEPETASQLAGSSAVRDSLSVGTTIGIRPEHMRLVGDEGIQDDEIAADLVVTGVELVGAESYVYGVFGAQKAEIAVRVPGYRHFDGGTPIRAAAGATSLHRFDSKTGLRLDSPV
ncbi:sn-glycerol-3-phosphate ABC transporter ATP-binding protein UgpC [Consotaella salsifontis]|uniref:Carbohydrate ABC transporter ATP-binding protein, CUT1 family n=1 Tax=Consotaella salsifontis TaxID=1365950 RepID=A0A1T4TBA7_9HYPH|nr:sn-glycerol-3-phosphate ABC transporter ATP-binding protein UgpC [Consotaella salsifontis]SKA37693.1 carbohydrate ABC transporter ATP-binding protein, CUT1 family [Consotaella salsifontis]